MSRNSIQNTNKNFVDDPWIRWGYAVLLFCIPFSVAYDLGPFSLELPSEPIMILLCLRLLPVLWQNRNLTNYWWRSPILVVAALWLIWMVVGIPWSVDPLVTAKYTLVAFTHCLLFAYCPVVLRLVPERADRHWFNYYTFAALLILFYAWWVHAQYDFRIDVTVLVARPFYFDHALFSACLSLLLGIYCFWTWQKIRGKDTDQNQTNGNLKIIYGLIALLLLLGIYLSYSRAAWISALLAILILIAIVLFKLATRLMLGITLLSLGSLLFFGPQLLNFIEQNQIESKKGNWWDQIVSVVNTTTDVSNLERLNRYSCALRMFQDRPVRGFGVGTFETAYLPYQRPEEMTRISVTSPGPHPPGRGGGAHSEYLQALSEMGAVGGLLFIGLLLASLFTALRIYWLAEQPAYRFLALALLFGLLTFFIHALFNNFFHHSKIAILIWSSMAILVNLDRPSLSKQSTV